MGGGDAESKRRNRLWSVRSYKCPDGKTHSAWLQNWFWDALDYLEREKNVDVEKLVNQCWASSRALEDEADYQFMAHLEFVIHDAWHQLVVMPEKGVANDNCYHWWTMA
jgi:hypothetical protein